MEHAEQPAVKQVKYSIQSDAERQGVRHRAITLAQGLSAERRHDRDLDRRTAHLAETFASRRADAEALDAAADLARRRQQVHADGQGRDQERARQRKAVERVRKSLRHAQHLARQQDRKRLRSALRRAASSPTAQPRAADPPERPAA